MYDELCKALERSIKVVSWFSLGDAITLASKLNEICRAYREDPKANRERLLRAADVTRKFLALMNGPNVRSTVQELSKLRTQIELET